MRCARSWSVVAVAVLGSGLAASTAGAASPSPRGRVAAAVVHPQVLSQGARGWLQRPGAAPAVRGLATPALGANLDENDQQFDLAAGQSETAVAAQTGTGGRRLVLAGWKDASAFLFIYRTYGRGSGTGIGLCARGARVLIYLICLPYNNVDQQW